MGWRMSWSRPFRGASQAVSRSVKKVAKQVTRIGRNIEDTADKWGDDIIESYDDLDKKVGRNVGAGGTDYNRDRNLPAAPDPDAGRLTPEEAQAEGRKRLSRIGKFFTSVLGDQSKANTGRQKVFS